MPERPLYKQIRRIPYIFLVLILISASIKVVSDWKSIGKTRLIEVTRGALKERTYRSVDLGENSFVTGMEGTLYWKVNNIREAFLVGMADGDRVISYFDVFYLLLLDICLFVMVARVNEETIFSDQLETGLKAILYCVMFYPFVGMIEGYYCSKFIQELTNNQFNAQYENFSISKFQIIFYLLLFMFPFVKRAINLQKQQNLTI